ncbi:Pr6Pr family membrane protein [Sphingobacterium sp. UBA7249]|uniref:Pr6Pr family membrane protein n=2 Tax=unclassified Sphingobacterium TaxID=2609468 RepID=UPI0032E4C6CA
MMLSQKSLAAFIALLSWGAIIAQFLISINNSTISNLELIIRFFSYFTILTNLMVAISCTSIVLLPNSAIGHFAVKPVTVTAVTLYILIVGLIYNFVLRFLWQPAGIVRIIDEILHLIIPILVLIYWWRSINKPLIQWCSIFSWLLYPIFYFLYTLWHGASSGFYPYPFVDVSVLGINRVLTNSLSLSLVFLLLGLLLILVTRLIAKNRG